MRVSQGLVAAAQQREKRLSEQVTDLQQRLIDAKDESSRALDTKMSSLHEANTVIEHLRCELKLKGQLVRARVEQYESLSASSAGTAATNVKHNERHFAQSPDPAATPMRMSTARISMLRSGARASMFSGSSLFSPVSESLPVAPSCTPADGLINGRRSLMSAQAVEEKLQSLAEVSKALDDEFEEFEPILEIPQEPTRNSLNGWSSMNEDTSRTSTTRHTETWCDIM